MSPISQTTPSTGAEDPKQAAYDALNGLLNIAAAAANNPDNTPAAQNAAFALHTAVSAQLDALDQAVFTGNTAQLQTAAAAMAPGMNQLKTLHTQISEIGNGLKEATSILSGIDNALTELSALG